MSVESEIRRDGHSVWDLRVMTTQWSVVADANLFVLRYVDAIRSYLQHLLRNESDVEDVLNEFLVRILEQGFPNVRPERGRFRNYLIRSVRNEVNTWHRTRNRREMQSGSGVALEEWTEDSDVGASAWIENWKLCLIDRCLQHVRQYEETHVGNHFARVLEYSRDNPDSSTETAAAELSAALGLDVSTDVYRKQLSRARKLFAESIVREVAETLSNPTPNDVIDELKATGLFPFVSKYLPKDWQVSG